MNLSFFSADALGMPLFVMPNECLRGEEYRTIPLGPFKVDLLTTAKSDFSTQKELTFWYTVGRLQCYLVVQERFIELMLLKPDQLADLSEHPESLKARLKELRPAIHKIFRYDGAKWYLTEQSKMG